MGTDMLVTFLTLLQEREMIEITDCSFELLIPNFLYSLRSYL